MNHAEIKTQLFRTLVLSALLLISTTTFAQSYDAGFTKYQRGDFKGAERSLLQALSKEVPIITKVKTLKILGICQFKLGNKNGAAKSFKDGLAVDRELSIDANEVIDPSIVDFFKRTKQEYVLANPQFSATPTPTVAASSPPVPVPKVPPPGIDVGSGLEVNSGAGKKKDGTYIIVESSNPEANVMIDGIRAGPVNSQIEVDPGPITVEISALGMEPKTKTIEAIKGHITTVTVELTKPKQKKMAKKKQKRKKRKQEDDMFDSKKSGYNPAAEFESDTGLSPYAPAPASVYQPGYQPGAAPGYAPQVASNNGQYGNNYQVRAAAHGNYFIAALPFGAGQFQNGSPLTGIGFFAGEAGSLYYYYSKSKSAKNSEAAIILFKEENTANGDVLSDEDKAFVEESEAYIASLKKKSTYGLYGFGVLWIAGVVEAIVNDPLTAAPKAQIQGPKPGRYSNLRLKENARLLSHDERHYKKDWQVQLLPEYDFLTDGSVGSESVKIQWELKF